MTIGDGIAMGMIMSTLIWSIAYVVGIHAKGSQGHWYPDHLGPKTITPKNVHAK